MLKLFIANKNYSSWSLRPWVLMKELRVPFEEELVPFGGNARHRTFREFSPSGRVPCLVDGSAGSRVVWDSLAITEYVAELEPRVWPRDPEARAWARSSAAEMHSGFQALRERCGMNCGLRVRLESLGPVEADLGRVDALWSQGLARFGGPFLCGAAFTAADAFYAPVAFRVQTYGLPLSPASAAYAARLLALPSMQEWYAAALAEPWREPEHEAEARRSGTVIGDLRK